MTKLSDNLFQLRKLHNLTQEQVAAELGVSRQAVAKWETGETTPDLSNCLALAQFYDVSLDDLVRFDSTQTGLPFPPKGKYCFGTVTVQEDGTIQLPQRAQDIFRLHPGASVLLLGDEERGLALLNANAMQELQTMLVDR
jgi:transcriptional regulator with XRE-family HTH domain